MIGVRTLIELGYLVAGLVAGWVLASLSAWSYPRATDDIWLVAYGCMTVSLLMGVNPIRRALRADREAAAHD